MKKTYYTCRLIVEIKEAETDTRIETKELECQRKSVKKDVYQKGYFMCERRPEYLSYEKAGGAR